LQIRTYEDAQGNKRKATQVVAESVYFCAPKALARMRRQWLHRRQLPRHR